MPHLGSEFMGRKLWVIALAIWFVLWGIFAITNVKVESQNLIMGILALAVGVLVVFDR